MLLSLLLLTLAQGTALQAPPTDSPLATALELVRQGEDERALEALQKIAAADPGNHMARLWIARIHDRGGRPDHAEAVYHSIWLEDPSNLDALLGAGLALLAQDRVEPAIGVLERAEMLAPQNADVMAALGQAYGRAGRSSRSLGYLQRATATSPTPDHRSALERARREQGHRVEIQTWGEEFGGGTPDTSGADLMVNVRASDTVRVSVRGQIQTKFGLREHRAGGGGEWRWTPSTTVSGQVLVGQDNVILPRRDYLGRVDYSHHAVTVTGAVRYFEFFGATVTMLSPAITWAPSNDWRLTARYAGTSTDTLAASSVHGSAAQFSAARALGRRMWLHGIYARGVENFDALSTDRLGDFRANTGTGAIEIVLPTATSIVGGYNYQRREDGVTMHRTYISLAQSF